MTDNVDQVAVLLCTYNGAHFLDAQLKSIAALQGCQARLYVSDDGSTDETLKILCDAHLGEGPHYSHLNSGPGTGPCANFLSLLLSTEVEGRYFAYCDQDDVWDNDKLSRALNKMRQLDDNQPLLYCARTRSISTSNKIIGRSPLFRKSPSFLNALVHNIGGGNTMVMNRAARQLLNTAGSVDVVSHDWWTYLLVSGAGGTVIYDPEPSLSYRQHSENQVGANEGLARRVRRYLKALCGSNRRWNDRNIAALRSNMALLTPSNRLVLESFVEFREAGLLKRLLGLKRTGLYAQTFMGNVGLFFATLLKKI
ncbi:MAG: glycosyltransferase family 2 protein [Halioglobus sp.]